MAARELASMVAWVLALSSGMVTVTAVPAGAPSTWT